MIYRNIETCYKKYIIKFSIFDEEWICIIRYKNLEIIINLFEYTVNKE